MTPLDTEHQSEFEGQLLQIPLRNGGILNLRLSMAAVPKVGPGPGPKKGDVLLSIAVSDLEVLNIESFMSLPVEAPILGGGTGPD